MGSGGESHQLYVQQLGDRILCGSWSGYYVAVGQVNDDNEYQYCITGGLGRAGATRHGTVGSRPFLKHYNLLIITYYRYCFFC